jgi:hypothetical protein
MNFVEKADVTLPLDFTPPRSQSCTLPSKVPKLNLSSIIPRNSESSDSSFVQIRRSFSTELVAPKIAQEPSLHLLLQKGMTPPNSENTSLPCPPSTLLTEKNDEQVYS